MKITKFLLTSIFIILLIAFFYFSISQNCKSLNIFRSIHDFGIGHVQMCFSLQNIKKNIKNTPLLYKSLLKIKKRFQSSKKIENKKKDLNSLKVYDKKQNLLEVPFIKGIINNEFIVKNNYLSSDNSYEYNFWYRSHGGNWNTKFNSGKKINRKNINKLELAWKYTSINKSEMQNKWKGNVELNPVFINKKIILATPDWKIVALNVENGNLIWELQSDFMPARRGIIVEHDKRSNLENLFVPIGDAVYKINAKDGKIIKNFGTNGFAKASTLVAPIIYKENIVIVGKEELFLFNKNTGKFVNKIEIHPKEKNFYGGIVWGGAALDKDKGIVYVNTGNPKPHLYGVNRPGDNKRSNSIVAIDLNKKKVIWDFQETMHDLWDLDIPSPPIIHNLKIDNNIFEVVISVTKRGNTIILERNTGKPIFDIRFKEAPKSKNDDEITSPFQINLEIPEKFSKIEYSLNDINKLSKEKQNEIKKILKKSNYGWFEAPSFEKNLVTLGQHGGAQWPGAAIDPINQHLFIPVNNVPWILKNVVYSTEINTSFPEEIEKYHETYIKKCSSCHGKKRNTVQNKKGEKLIELVPGLVGFYTIPSLKNKFISIKEINNKHKMLNLTFEELKNLQKLFEWWDKKLHKNNEIDILPLWYQFLTNDGLPAINPPWGYIAKLDLVSGKILFKSPVGYLNINGKNKKIGTPSYGGAAINGAGILFFSGTEDSKAYAIDSNNGEELWSYKMESAGSAPPIIYTLNGKQYVSFVSTGGIFHNFKKKGSSIYTFTVYE